MSKSSVLSKTSQKKLADKIDEGLITNSFDLVDYTADYLNELDKTRKEVN